MTFTVAALAALTAVLLFANVRTLTDEDLSRQLTRLTNQLQQVPPAELDARVAEVVAASSSSLFTVVALSSDGAITSVSAGPQSIREALADAPAMLAAANTTTEAASLQLGDTSLRYVAGEAPGGGRVMVFASSDDIRDRALQMAAIAAGIGMVFVLTGTAATLWALNRAIQPLTELANQTRRLSSDARTRVEVAADPAEVHDLAEQLNHLLDRIEEAQRRRNTFLATVSHEVRTPLAIARGHLEALSRYGWSVDNDLDSLAIASSEVARAGRMVESLLTLARSEEPGFVHLREVPLRDFADDLNLRLAGLEVSVVVAPPPACRVRVDTERLAQAVLNAVTNSMVHNEDSVRVKVGWSVTGNVLSIIVDDDGAGFPPTPADELIRPFAHNSPGTSGLGLAVIDTISRGHGGSVELGQSPSGGARVVLFLPEAARY